MEEESAPRTVFQKMDETDRLLIDTSPLSEGIREKIANRIAETVEETRSVSFRLIRSSFILAFVFLSFLLQIVLVKDNTSEGKVLTVVMLVSVCIMSAAIVADFNKFLSLLRERSDLRAKLIQGER